MYCQNIKNINLIETPQIYYVMNDLYVDIWKCFGRTILSKIRNLSTKMIYLNISNISNFSVARILTFEIPYISVIFIFNKLIFVSIIEKYHSSPRGSWTFARCPQPNGSVEKEEECWWGIWRRRSEIIPNNLPFIIMHVLCAWLFFFAFSRVNTH